MHLAFETKRELLKNVDDGAGQWQFEGGELLNGTNVVGHYASERRVIFRSTESQNTAMLKMTLFFVGHEPPENITLEGAHDFHSGSEVGSVSAASAAYATHIGKQFHRVDETLTIG